MSHTMLVLSSDSKKALQITILLLLSLCVVGGLIGAWRFLNVTDRLRLSSNKSNRNIIRKPDPRLSTSGHTLVNRTYKRIRHGRFLKAQGVDFEMLPKPATSKSSPLRSKSLRSSSSAGSKTLVDESSMDSGGPIARPASALILDHRYLNERPGTPFG